MKNNQDNLENLFNRRFNEEEAITQKEGWNVPADEVWERIHIGLNKEEEVTRRVVYWPLVAVAASFLLLSIFPLYQSKQNMDLLAAKLESNEQVLKSMQQELMNVAANTRSQQKIAFQEKEVLNAGTILKESRVLAAEKMPITKREIVLTNSPYSDLSMQQPNRPFYREMKKPNAKKIGINATAQNNTKELTNSYVIAPPLSGNALDKGVAVLNASNTETIAKSISSTSSRTLANATSSHTRKNFSPLPNLPILPQELAINSPIQAVVAHPAIEPIAKKKFYLAATIAPVWRTLNRKNTAADELINFRSRTIQQKSAFSAGIQAGMNLKNGWSVETGLRYTNTNNAVHNTTAITYQQVEEQLNKDGTYESNVNIQMDSPAGLTETVVVLSRDAISTVEEGTKIDLKFAFTNAQSFIDIPVLARKQWRVGNLGLGITAGLLNRFLLEKNFDLPTITLEDQRFNAQSMYISEKEGEKSTTYSPYYLVGLDVEYEIYPGLYVFISPTLSNSIRPTIGADGADIYAMEKMLNMGVRYQL